MGENKNSKLEYVIILLLFANTLFLGGIFFTLQNCKSQCPMMKGAAEKMCPWSGGADKGSMGSQKGSM